MKGEVRLNSNENSEGSDCPICAHWQSGMRDECKKRWKQYVTEAKEKLDKGGLI